MFRHQIAHFSIAGFEIKIDVSWLFIALLISWSLAQGFFPALYSGLPSVVYWWMGVAGVIGLFFSLVFHELCHSLVARRYGLPIRGITLFLFGGVAEMESEPMTPKIEFLMAIAGPVSSMALAIAFAILAGLGDVVGVSEYLTGVLHYLASLNIVLAVFNLIPAFPMDGGRVLRSALWYLRKNLVSATVTAAKVGGIFGIFLIVAGILLAFSGNIGAGIWWALIGMFLRGAAADSLYQMSARRTLAGTSVRQFMIKDPITVTAAMSLRELVDGFIFKHLHDVFPVVDGDRPVGLIGVEQVRNVPRDAWESTEIAKVMVPISKETSVDASEDATKALSLMQRDGKGKLLVTEAGRLVGVLSLKDIATLLSIKMELEPLG